MIVASAFVEVGADLTRLNSELAGAAPAAQKAGESVGQSFSQGFKAKLDSVSSTLTSLGSALTVGVTLPLVGLGAAAIKSSADLDALKRGLTAVTGSADEAERQFNELREVAKLPGLGLEEAARGATNLQAFGFSAQQSIDILKNFGNALASVGKGRVELDRVILQLGQMAGAGRVLMQDLRPIIQQVPQVATIIKEQFGPEALAAPQETLEALGLTAQDFIAVLVRELGKLPSVTGGLKNELENFSDTVKIALARVGDAMTPVVTQVIGVLVPAIETAVRVFTSLPQPVQTAGVVLAGVFAASGPIIVGMGLMVRSVSDLIGIFGSLSKALENTRLVAIATRGALLGVITVGVVEQIVSASDEFDKLRDTLEAMRGPAEDARASIEGIDRATDSAGSMMGRLAELGSKAAEIISEAWDKAFHPIAAAIEAINEAIQAAEILTKGRSSVMDKNVQDKLSQLETEIMGPRQSIEELIQQRAAARAASDAALFLASTADSAAIAMDRMGSSAARTSPELQTLATSSNSAADSAARAAKAAEAAEAAAKARAQSTKEHVEAVLKELETEAASLASKGQLGEAINLVRSGLIETVTAENGLTVALESGVVAIRGAAGATHQLTEEYHAAGNAAEILAANAEKTAAAIANAAHAASQAGAEFGKLTGGSIGLPGFGPGGNGAAGTGLPTDLMGFIQSIVMAGAVKTGPELGAVGALLEQMGFTRTGLREFDSPGNVMAQAENLATQAGPAVAANFLEMTARFTANLNGEVRAALLEAANRFREMAAAARESSTEVGNLSEHLEDTFKASEKAAPTIDDLQEQLWRLIDAGKGNSGQAFALRQQLDLMTNAYSDGASAVTRFTVAGVRAGSAIIGTADVVEKSLQKIISSATNLGRKAGISILPELTPPSAPSVPRSGPTSGISVGPSDLQYQGQSNIVINAPGAVFGQDAPQYFLDQVTELLRRDGRLG